MSCPNSTTHRYAVGMHGEWLILPASRSPRIAAGLTYAEGKHSPIPGSLVHAPLRGRVVEGIVLRHEREQVQRTYAIREIAEVIGAVPLLTPAQIATAVWMSQRYCCNLRQALSVFLPATPWKPLVEGLPRPPLPATVPMRSAPPPQPLLLLGGSRMERHSRVHEFLCHAVAAGGQAILLVPELLDAEEHLTTLHARIGEGRLALVHSGLTRTHERRLWQRIANGDIRCVVGTRSALFAPCRALACAAVCDEHARTYRSERTPRYSACDVAETLCRETCAQLIVSAAISRVESWAKVRAGTWRLQHLPDPSPLRSAHVRVVDGADAAGSAAFPFTPVLLNAIQERLQRREIAILLLNRRGLSTALICLDCRRRATTEDGRVLTLHRDATGTPVLRDPLSDAPYPVHALCHHCGSARLHAIGAGTQRIEEMLRRLFPVARVLRIDRDVPHGTQSLRTALDRAGHGEADILVGTQPVLHALALPRVTLAAVLSADSGLMLPHFRAGEHVVQLLAYVRDRCNPDCDVIFQAMDPRAREVQAAASGALEMYLDEELQQRVSARYPPAVSLIRLIVKGDDAQARALALQRTIAAQNVRAASDIIVHCVPTSTGGARGWQVLLRGNDPSQLLPSLDLRGVTVDPDPPELL